jgi:DNA-binding NarL/FixJ family response regulator
MRVVVADDVMLIREGLTRVLEAAGIEVVGQAASADELLAKARAERPDVVIVDTRMPPTHTDEGIVAAARAQAELPATGVVVLSQYLEASYALRLINAHPERVAYLLKDRIKDPAMLVDALERVIEGETVVDPTIVARLLGRQRRRDPLAELTPRERQVLGLMAEGLSNRAIATRMDVGERTVEAHIAQILLKLEVDDSPDLHRRVLAVLTLLHDGT